MQIPPGNDVDSREECNFNSIHDDSNINKKFRPRRISAGSRGVEYRVHTEYIQSTYGIHAENSSDIAVNDLKYRQKLECQQIKSFDMRNAICIHQPDLRKGRSIYEATYSLLILIGNMAF